METGKWKADLRGTYVASDDFEHDVRLYVNGDFADDDLRVKYAQEIAKRLNAYNHTP